MKQIAGRAGRFRSQYPIGYVTCATQKLLDSTKALLAMPISKITHAVIFPTYDQLYRMSLLLQNNRIGDVLNSLTTNAKYGHDQYNLLVTDQMKTVSSIIDDFTFNFKIKHDLMVCPINIKCNSILK